MCVHVCLCVCVCVCVCVTYSTCACGYKCGQFALRENTQPSNMEYSWLSSCSSGVNPRPCSLPTVGSSQHRILLLQFMNSLVLHLLVDDYIRGEGCGDDTTESHILLPPFVRHFLQAKCRDLDFSYIVSLVKVTVVVLYCSVLVQYCYCTGTVLELVVQYCYCTGTVLELYWNCTGTVLELYWNWWCNYV